MPADTVPDIESLRRRHRDLDRLKAGEEANLANARKNLDELQSQARRDYGTDDLEALRKQLAELEAENTRKRAAYDAHLREIQLKLDEVKARFGSET